MKQGPYIGNWENGYFVCRDTSQPEGNQIFLMHPVDHQWLIEQLNKAFIAGVDSAASIKLSDEFIDFIAMETGPSHQEDIIRQSLIRARDKGYFSVSGAFTKEQIDYVMGIVEIVCTGEYTRKAIRDRLEKKIIEL